MGRRRSRDLKEDHFDVRHIMSIDSYRFLDFASRQVMKAWAARQEQGVIPFTPLAKPLRECTIALVSTAGIARNDDQPFNQERERRDPWWGDPSFRVIPLGTTEQDVRLYHMHIDPRFGQEDLDVEPEDQVVRQLLLTLWNVYSFFTTYASVDGFDPFSHSAPAIADRMRSDDVDAVALVPA